MPTSLLRSAAARALVCLSRRVRNDGRQSVLGKPYEVLAVR